MDIDLKKLRHDIQSKCATLHSASQTLNDCDSNKLERKLTLMTKECREIERCLFDMQKAAAKEPPSSQAKDVLLSPEGALHKDTPRDTPAPAANALPPGKGPGTAETHS